MARVGSLHRPGRFRSRRSTCRLYFMIFLESNNFKRHSRGRLYFASLTKKEKHTTLGIRWSSPTQLLIKRSLGYPGGSDGTLIFQAAVVVCTHFVAILVYTFIGNRQRGRCSSLHEATHPYKEQHWSTPQGKASNRISRIENLPSFECIRPIHPQALPAAIRCLCQTFSICQQAHSSPCRDTHPPR